MVDDPYGDPRGPGPAGYLDPFPRWGVLHRILDQIREYPLELGGVGMNQWQVRRQAQLDRMVSFESPGGGDGQLAQVTPVRARRYGAGLDPRQVEQIADQLRQPCALRLDGGDQPQALLA